VQSDDSGQGIFAYSATTDITPVVLEGDDEDLSPLKKLLRIPLRLLP
jgi:hypothetical protein